MSHTISNGSLTLMNVNMVVNLYHAIVFGDTAMATCPSGPVYWYDGFNVCFLLNLKLKNK